MRLPHPLVLLLGAVAVAVAATWIVPAGKYERRTDEATKRQVVVPGTYARVAATPVGPAAAVMTVPRGIVAAAEIILTVLFVGGAFALLDQTGALARLVGSLVGHTRHPRLIVVVVSIAFAILGALENMHEEIIALIPVLLLLSEGLGFGAITAVAMSAGAAVVGSAFGLTNPFQAGLALKLAQLPPVSQPLLRFGLFVAAVAVWISYTLAMTSRDDVKPETTATTEKARTRDFLLLAIVLVPFVPYVYGVLQLDWGFNELSALFLVAGFAVGVASGLSLSESAKAFLKGMETMLAAGLFIGVARGITVAMNDGQILDTILFALAESLKHMPGFAAVALMVPMHALLHIPIPSVSSQAVLTMPIMAPLCDLLGRSRDAAVLAYQTGAGLMDMLAPTKGALLAMLLGARVNYGRWVKFALPGALLVAIVGLVGIALAG